MQNFRDKVAVITGGASGIGRAVALLLASEGAHVVVADIDAAMAAATRATLFQRIEDEGALILSGHFPFPGIGRRVTIDGWRDYVPVG